MSRAWRCFSPACRRKFPATTVNRLCGSSMDAVAIAARAIKSGEAGFPDRGRSGEHVSRAFCDGQGGCGVFSFDETGRHHHGLAIHQSGAQGEVWHGHDAGNRRELSPKNSTFHAPIRMHFALAQPAAGGRGHESWASGAKKSLRFPFHRKRASRQSLASMSIPGRIQHSKRSRN